MFVATVNLHFEVPLKIFTFAHLPTIFIACFCAFEDSTDADVPEELTHPVKEPVKNAKSVFSTCFNNLISVKSKSLFILAYIDTFGPDFFIEYSTGTLFLVVPKDKYKVFCCLSSILSTPKISLLIKLVNFCNFASSA